MKKKISIITLAIAIIISMMPSFVVFADQTPVTYLDASGNTQTCTNYVSIDEAIHTESVTEGGGTFTKTNVVLSADTTYIVDTNNYENWFWELKLLGDATLIFKDGKNFSVGHIDLASHNLKVYAQKNDQNSMFDISGYYQQKSAINNGTLTVNSGNIHLSSSTVTSAEATPDTIGSNSKLVVNNGFVSLIGGIYNATFDDGCIGAGQGITINNCITVAMVGGVILDASGQIIEQKKAFRNLDLGKFTLNGDYNINGYTFNYGTQNYEYTAFIQKENMSAQLGLYDQVSFSPKSGGGGNPGGNPGGNLPASQEEEKVESADAEEIASEVIDIIEQTVVTKNSVKALKNGKITVSFKAPSFGEKVSSDKISSIKYTIQRSTKKNFKKSVKNYTVKSSKGTVKFTDSKKLKKGTKYYYRVRGTVSLVNGSTVKTKWSSTKSVKCKKTRK